MVTVSSVFKYNHWCLTTRHQDSINELEKVISDSREAGMQSYVDSLVDLVEKNYVHPKVAQAASPSPEEIKMRLRGIKTR